MLKRLLSWFKADWRRITGPLVISLAMVAVANAGPMPYINNPLDTVQNLINTSIANYNSGQTGGAILCTSATNTTALNATCNSLRDDIIVNSLTTATNGVTTNAVTVNDSAVTAASQINCQVNQYASNGIPAAVNVIPSNGTFTYQISNISQGGAALNANVLVACQIFN
jgi:DNA-directed RNA polymerase